MGGGVHLPRMAWKPREAKNSSPARFYLLRKLEPGKFAWLELQSKGCFSDYWDEI